MAIDDCRLCGSPAKMTKDHIQPQCAFNEKQRRYVKQPTHDGIIKPGRTLIGAKHDRTYADNQPTTGAFGGIYRMTQCEQCNSYLGSNYDARFGAWCHDALNAIKPGKIIVVQNSYEQSFPYPLSILKRIIAMFFSIHSPEFAGVNSDTAAFVLDRESTELPARFRYFVGHTVNDVVCHIPGQGRIDTRDGKSMFIAQIAHPPFVYVLTDGGCPDARLTEITEFSKYTYDDIAKVKLTLRVLDTNTCYAGDYRSRGPLLQDHFAILKTDQPSYYYRILDTVL